MDDIEAKKQLLLDTLRKLGAGDFHGRHTIAGALGKARLNVAETTLLDVLVQQGVLERRLVPTDRAQFNRYEYRIVQKGE